MANCKQCGNKIYWGEDEETGSYRMMEPGDDRYYQVEWKADPASGRKKAYIVGEMQLYKSHKAVCPKKDTPYQPSDQGPSFSFGTNKAETKEDDLPF